MKRAILITAVLFLAGAGGVFAQQFEDESEYYPKTMQIHRIFSHSLGYRIDYVREDFTIATFWAPIEWFRFAGGIASIAFGKGRAFPYVSFFYKNGELDHFRLYLVEDPAHPSWGVLDRQTDHSGDFPAADAVPEINY